MISYSGVIRMSGSGTAAVQARAFSPGKLDPSETALFVCDVQERFRAAITGFDQVIDTSRRMIRAADALELPLVLVTEQYPQKLGSTVSELKEVMAENTPVVAKTKFSMMVPEVLNEIEQKPKVKKVLLTGIETHVCILQTTLDLIERGYEVHVLVDGVSSQRLGDRQTAFHRLSQSGAFLATSEMVLFQMMENTTHPGFKSISSLVKEQRPHPQLPAPGSS